MEWLARDFRYAVRAARREPGTSLLAIVVLALGIAGTTVTYSGVEAVTLRSLPFRDPDRLVDVKQIPRERRPGTLGGATNSELAFQEIQSSRDSFEDVAGYVGEQPVLTGLGPAERIQAWHVTANFFPLLGVTPLMGRGFRPEEDRPGATPAVIASYGFWMSHFRGDPRVLGHTLTLDSASAEIVGVMPRGFDYPRATALWRAMGTQIRARGGEGPQGGYWILGRLRPGVTRQAAQAELDARWLRLARAHPRYEGWSCNLSPLRAYLAGTAKKPLWLLLGAATLVLIVACANVANLFLVRAVARQREVAVRLALGATRARVVRQFLSEALLLASIGGTMGVVLAGWAAPLLGSLASRELPGLADVAINGNVLSLSLIVTVLTGVVFGLAPGIRAARQRSLVAAQASVTRWKSRTGDAALVAQLALTMVLLAATGLVTVSLARLMGVDTGYRADRVVAAHLMLPRDRYAQPTHLVAFANHVIERLRVRQQVTGAAVSTGMPLATGMVGTIAVDGEPERDKAPASLITAVTEDYFGVLRIPLHRGRWLRFDGTDHDSVLVNEALARHYFPGKDPLGHRVSFYGKRDAVVVGIVADTRDWDLPSEPGPHIYQPFEAAPRRFVKILVRASADTGVAAGVLREVLREADPNLPIDRLVTLREMMAESAARQRLVTVLLLVFAALALAISAAGVYGLVAHNVARRQQEMGIRIALGAGSRRILTLVVGRGMTLTCLGILLGIVGALIVGRLLTAFLFEVTARDPRVLVGVAVLLATVTALASYIPARRAARIDPSILLRTE